VGVIDAEGVPLAPTAVTAATATGLVKWIPDHSTTTMALAAGDPEPHANVMESDVVCAAVILQ
jgi:hypothetical protein